MLRLVPYVVGLLVVAGVLSLLIMRGVRWRTARVILLVPTLSVLALIAVQLPSLPVQPAASEDSAALQTIDQSIVDYGDLTVSVSGSGVIAPAHRVPLVFEYSAPVKEVLIKAGQQVHAGDLLARLDAPDLDAMLQDAQIALDAQQVAFNALTAPARDVDIAAAQAALNAALAAYNAASVSGTSDEEKQIAHYQSELARNQVWQLQLQRDSAKQASSPQIPNVSQTDLDNLGITVTVQPNVLDTVNSAIDQYNARQAAPAKLQVEQLEAQLNAANIGVNVADANYTATVNKGPDYGALSSAKESLVRAQIALDRLKNGLSQTDIDEANLDVQRAQLAVDQAQANVNRAILVAPFDGVIAQNNLVVGELPPDGAAMLLVDTSSYYVDLPVDETDIVNVRVGQRVSLKLDALPDQPITGEVTRVALTPTQVGQLVTYNVRVMLDPTAQPVRVGMSATAQITVNEVHHTLILRNSFIRIDRETQAAFVTIERADSTSVEVPVALGARNETYSEIVSGVSAGQKVVLIPRNTFNPLGGAQR
jgi:HlyD family secretion protein